MGEAYEVAFTLILHAGNARSKALQATEAAREGAFFDAEEYLRDAEKELQLAHQTQTDLIQREARGKATELNILMVHAQDHLSGAMITLEQAREFLYLYKLLAKLPGCFMETENN